MIYTPRHPLRRRRHRLAQIQHPAQHLLRLRTGTTTIMCIRRLLNPHRYLLQDRQYHLLIRMRYNKPLNNGSPISNPLDLSTLIMRQLISMIRVRKQ